ncbi:hypothetical protein GGI04_003328 [Coemansia thaxteri]|nr:hypothetical protein GGI04_003328 [Coemansia thaxteri]
MPGTVASAHVMAMLGGIIYLVAVTKEWLAFKYLLKPAVTLLIAYPTKDSTAGIFYGLLLSTLGDIFLMIPRQDMFIPGLLSFLLAHIVYIASFRNASLRMSWAAVPLAAYAAVMMSALLPGVSKEDAVVQVGVVIYVLVITVMAYKASLTGNALLVAGTLLFCASDSILAWDKFLHSYSWCEFGIMLTYYAAQLCISIAHS